MLKSKNLNFSKENLKKALKFLELLLACYVFLFFIIQPLISGIQLFVSVVAGKMLSLVGVRAEIMQTDFIGLWIAGRKIEISFICTGITEMLLLISAIAASIEINWRKRIVGIAAGIVLIFVFNLLRIFFTIMELLNTNLEFAELIHGIFFRIFLFLCLAGFYFAWSKWAGKK